MRELGYVEGKDFLIEGRYAGGDYKRLPELAADLVKAKVDIIVTDGTPPTLAAQKATRKIPIIFVAVGDAVGSGLVQSLARPGGNTTGVSLLLRETTIKQLELLISIVPKLSRVAIVSNPSNPSAPIFLGALYGAIAEARLTTVSIEASSPQEVDRAFSRMKKEGVGAFVLTRDAFLTQQRSQIVDLAARARLPGIAGHPAYPEAGGLMSYGVSNELTYRRASVYVDKILKGANPGDLPVEQPTKFELVINHQTANALGLKIPPELLLQADKVIE
jgi:putative ABC transport system substrate-binding protein